MSFLTESITKDYKRPFAKWDKLKQQTRLVDRMTEKEKNDIIWASGHYLFESLPNNFIDWN